MYVNLETAFAATRVEQRLADLRATKLGPIVAEIERGSRPAPSGPTSLLSVLAQRLVDYLRSALHRSPGHTPDFEPGTAPIAAKR